VAGRKKTKRISVRSGPAKRKQGPPGAGPKPTNILKALAVVCVLAGIAAGIVLLEKYVKRTVPGPEGTVNLELIAEPGWVNDELRNKIYNAVAADGKGLKLDETLAQRARDNIETLVVWLDDVEVQTMYNQLRVKGRWRKPLVLVKRGLDSFYVDKELVVLDFVAIPELPIVRVKGLSVTMKTPSPGEIWQRDDLAAAVKLIALLSEQDEIKTADKPLLGEIASIDVSNYNGRENSRFAHIILYTTDNTEVIWGAELGKYQRHLEATDAEKLAKLYAYYEEHGSLLEDVKYIDLREPQNNIPLPTDRY